MCTFRLLQRKAVCPDKFPSISLSPLQNCSQLLQHFSKFCILIFFKPILFCWWSGWHCNMTRTCICMSFFLAWPAFKRVKYQGLNIQPAPLTKSTDEDLDQLLKKRTNFTYTSCTYVTNKIISSLCSHA